MKAKIRNTDIIVEVEKTSKDSYYCKEKNIVFRKCNLDFNLAEKAVIEGWVARDKDGELELYSHKPKRKEDRVWWPIHGNGWDIEINPTLFPSLTWESEPRKAKIEITLLDEEN